MKTIIRSLLASVVMSVATAHAAATDIIEFMRNPPVVREIVAGKYAPSAASAQAPSYFLIRFQTNGLYLKYSPERDNLPDAAGLSGYELACGSFNDDKWAFCGARYCGGRNILYIAGPEPPKDIVGSIQNIEVPAHVILNMGIGYFKEGTIPWNNDTYQAEQSKAFYKAGRAIRDESGRVTRIELVSRILERNHWLTNTIVLAYSYDTNFPTAGLPTLITTVRYANDGRTIELDRWRIFSATLGGTPLKQTQFQPHLLPPDTMTALGSNNVTIASSATMTPRPVLGFDDPVVKRFDRRSKATGGAYFLLGAITLAIAPILLAIRYRRSTRQRRGNP